MHILEYAIQEFSQYVHLCDPNHCQHIEHHHPSRKISLPLPSHTHPQPIWGNYCSDFFHHRLILLILELHINGIMQYEHYGWLFSNRMMFWRIIHDTVYNSFFTVEYYHLGLYHHLSVSFLPLWIKAARNILAHFFVNTRYFSWINTW